MLVPYELPRSTPAALGIDPAAVLNFLDSVEQAGLEIHSFKLLRHGQVAAEGTWAPYDAALPHIEFSLSKTVTSTAIGFAVQEGLLTVDDPVTSFFPDHVNDEIRSAFAGMNVRHLLSMSTGHDVETGALMRRDPDGDYVRAFFGAPPAGRPGEFFLYNSGASYMLSAIVTQRTGLTMLDYLRPRLFDPLGIDYAFWESCPRGRNDGASGLWLTIDSVARLGQFYLQQGRWNGRQLLNEAWIAEATSLHTPTNDGKDGELDWKRGYGYQIWRCRLEGAYRLDGAFGQLSIVLPEQDAVVALNCGTGRTGEVFERIWRHLLPGFAADAPLTGPESGRAETALKTRLANLAYAPLEVRPVPDLSREVSGRWYLLEGNAKGLEAACFRFEADRCVVRLRDARGEHAIACGFGRWLRGATLAAENEWVHPLRVPWPLAVCGHWEDERTLHMIWRFIGTTFTVTLECRFEADQVAMKFTRNLTFEPYEFPEITGRMIN